MIGRPLARGGVAAAGMLVGLRGTKGPGKMCSQALPERSRRLVFTRSTTSSGGDRHADVNPASGRRLAGLRRPPQRSTAMGGR